MWLVAVNDLLPPVTPLCGWLLAFAMLLPCGCQTTTSSTTATKEVRSYVRDRSPRFASSSESSAFGSDGANSTAKRSQPRADDKPSRVELVAYEEPADSTQTAQDDADSEIQIAEGAGGRPTVTKHRNLLDRLKIPQELPGSEVKHITLPKYNPERANPERDAAIEHLFPELAPIPQKVQPAKDDARQPLSLDELEDIAVKNNPLIMQAQADVEAAIGTAIDVGAYPNPMVGYESDTVGSAGTRDYQGFYFSQIIKTGGKLELAQAAANVNVMNKQLALRRAKIDLLTRVRAAYYAVLVAKENENVTQALTRFAEEAFRIQREQLSGGIGAAYEPTWLRAQSDQMRAALSLAQIRYISAWKQLAATLGTPSLPSTEVEGRFDDFIPVMNFDDALERTLSVHTDMLTARNMEVQARFLLKLEEVQPVPDVYLYSTYQKDFTGAPLYRTTYNVQLGIPLPIFDRNKGGIKNAHGNLVRAAEEINRVRNTLSQSLADAFERYQSNRVLVETYRKQIIPDLTRTFRGAFERHQVDTESVGFADVAVAQQNLLTSITTYISALGAYWTAFTDVAGLLQVEQLHDISTPREMPPAPLPPAEPQP